MQLVPELFGRVGARGDRPISAERDVHDRQLEIKAFACVLDEFLVGSRQRPRHFRLGCRGGVRGRSRAFFGCGLGRKRLGENSQDERGCAGRKKSGAFQKDEIEHASLNTVRQAALRGKKVETSPLRQDSRRGPAYRTFSFSLKVSVRVVGTLWWPSSSEGLS